MTKAVKKTRTLEECEANIERCLRSFWEVGEDYRYIRDTPDPESGKKGLYRKTHSTWAEYCQDRWGLTGDTVTVVVRATDVRKRLLESNPAPAPDSLPKHVEQARALAWLPEEEQPEAWAEAVEVAKAEGKKQPTREDVKRVVRRRKKPTGEPGPTASDTAHDAAKGMRDRADSFARSVEILMPHMSHLTEDEVQGCAYKIVETVNSVMATLEEAGYVAPDVVRGVLGITSPEDGRIEVVA